MPMPGHYFGAIHINDGKTSEWIRSTRILCEGDASGYTFEYKTNGHLITETKVKRGNQLVEWVKFGAFQRAVTHLNGHRISKPMTFRFHPQTRQSLHGLQERQDQVLFGARGKTRSWYSRGKWTRQEFRYRNRRLAFRINHFDREVTIKYPNGAIAGIVRCPGGFSTRSGRYPSDEFWDREEVVHRCHMGKVYFPFKRAGLRGDTRNVVWDFSKDGNSWISFRDRKGRVWLQGEYRNRQRTGEWILNRRHVYYVRGVPISKELWDTAPTKMKFKQILRIKDVQMRAALIARAGYARFAKEVKHKVIHEDKTRGNKLMEFPIRVSDGNGGRNSFMRLLQVTCTSTKEKYFLNVPDFVWDDGKRTKLDTCEKARQWTFGVDRPRDQIKFAKET
jgi:hypothetical protein